jgi:hypothetical protein
MDIYYPNGATMASVNLGTLPDKFAINGPPATPFPAPSLAAYGAHLKTTVSQMAAASAAEFEALKSVSDIQSWLIALDACKLHLEAGELDEFESALETVEENLEIIADFIPTNAYESIQVYIAEWRESMCDKYRLYIQFVKLVDQAAANGCFAIINSH